MLNWTEALLEQLIRLDGLGMTSSQISAEFGRDGLICSRNAIIGKIHRMITAGRMSPRPVNLRSERARPKPDRKHGWRGSGVVKPPSLPQDPPAAQPVEAIVREHGLVRITDLGPFPPSAERCRWPMGPVMAKAEFFCGAAPYDGLPYCITHARQAYTPGTARRNY